MPSSKRTITLSTAPEPSITVTRAKPGPARLKEKTSPRLRRSRHAIDENGDGGDRAGDFQGHGSRTAVGGAQIEPSAIGRKQDVQPRLRLAGAIARRENA